MKLSSSTGFFVVVVVGCLTFTLQGTDAIRCASCDTTTGDVGCASGQQPVPTIRKCPDTHQHCITVTKYSVDGTMKSMARNCSPVSLPASCLVGTDKQTREPLKVCYSTCSEDACNWSSTSSLQQLLNLL